MSTTDLASPDKAEIRRIFDTIAFRYDFLNSFLSLRLDEVWRRRALRLVLDGSESSILDLGTGTGKFLELFLRQRKWQKAWGIDFSARMLAQARHRLPPHVVLVRADFHDLPILPGQFDLVVGAFTLRSVKDMSRFLAGVFDILSPKGKAAFLCLTRPKGMIRFLYSLYLKCYLPFVGCFVSGDHRAYQFLSKSIQAFQDPEVTAGMMKAAGFSQVLIRRFTFGVATLIIAQK